MIKFERLPADIFSRIPNVKRVLLEDENIIFAYLLEVKRDTSQVFKK
jgi:hypothetical protein